MWYPLYAILANDILYQLEQEWLENWHGELKQMAYRRYAVL